jgi:hypothetical protein
VAHPCWPKIHHWCVLWIHLLWVFCAMCWMVTNWSSLVIAYSIDESMCKQAFNTLTRIKVIWSIIPIWNIFIIQYFLSVWNSNKQRCNATLVGAKNKTSNLWDHRRARYQLSHATSLVLILLQKINSFWISICFNWSVSLPRLLDFNHR